MGKSASKQKAEGAEDDTPSENPSEEKEQVEAVIRLTDDFQPAPKAPNIAVLGLNVKNESGADQMNEGLESVWNVGGGDDAPTDNERKYEEAMRGEDELHLPAFIGGMEAQDSKYGDRVPGSENVMRSCPSRGMTKETFRPEDEAVLKQPSDGGVVAEDEGFLDGSNLSVSPIMRPSDQDKKDTDALSLEKAADVQTVGFLNDASQNVSGSGCRSEILYKEVDQENPAKVYESGDIGSSLPDSSPDSMVPNGVYEEGTALSNDGKEGTAVREQDNIAPEGRNGLEGQVNARPREGEESGQLGVGEQGRDPSENTHQAGDEHLGQDGHISSPSVVENGANELQNHEGIVEAEPDAIIGASACLANPGGVRNTTDRYDIENGDEENRESIQEGDHMVNDASVNKVGLSPLNENPAVECDTEISLEDDEKARDANSEDQQGVTDRRADFKEPIMMNHFKEFLSMLHIGKKSSTSQDEDDPVGDSVNGNEGDDGDKDDVKGGVKNDTGINSTENDNGTELVVPSSQENLRSDEHVFETLGGMMMHSGVLRQQENAEFSFPVHEAVSARYNEKLKGDNDKSTIEGKIMERSDIAAKRFEENQDERENEKYNEDEQSLDDPSSLECQENIIEGVLAEDTPAAKSLADQMLVEQTLTELVKDEEHLKEIDVLSADVSENKVERMDPENGSSEGEPLGEDPVLLDEVKGLKASLEEKDGTEGIPKEEGDMEEMSLTGETSADAESERRTLSNDKVGDLGSSQLSNPPVDDGDDPGVNSTGDDEDEAEIEKGQNVATCEDSVLEKEHDQFKIDNNIDDCTSSEVKNQEDSVPILTLEDEQLENETTPGISHTENNAEKGIIPTERTLETKECYDGHEDDSYPPNAIETKGDILGLVKAADALPDDSETERFRETEEDSPEDQVRTKDKWDENDQNLSEIPSVHKESVSLEADEDRDNSQEEYATDKGTTEDGKIEGNMLSDIEEIATGTDSTKIHPDSVEKATIQDDDDNVVTPTMMANKGGLSRDHANYVSIDHSEEYIVRDVPVPALVVDTSGKARILEEHSEDPAFTADSNLPDNGESCESNRIEGIQSEPQPKTDITSGNPSIESSEKDISTNEENAPDEEIVSTENQGSEEGNLSITVSPEDPFATNKEIPGKEESTEDSLITTSVIMDSAGTMETNSGENCLEKDLNLQVEKPCLGEENLKDDIVPVYKERLDSTDTNSLSRDVSVDSEGRLGDTESEDFSEAVSLSREVSVDSDSDDISSARTLSELDDFVPESPHIDLSDELGIIYEDTKHWDEEEELHRSELSFDVRQDDRGIMLSDDEDEVFEADAENGSEKSDDQNERKIHTSGSGTSSSKITRTQKIGHTRVRFAPGNLKAGWVAAKRQSQECVPEVEGLDGSLREAAVRMSKMLTEAEQAHRPDSPDIEGAQAKVTLQAYGLKIGDKVVVGGVKTGVLRFCGPTEFASGIWAGIELDEAAGKNDGGVGGVSYFKCSPKHGIFAPVSKISKPGILVNRSSSLRKAVNYGHVDTSNVKAKVDTEENTEEKKEAVDDIEGLNRPRTSRSGGRQPMDDDLLDEGERVLVAGQRRGLIRFSGETEFAPGWWYGIELDRPVGKNDGSVNGRRYFTCKPKHGVFAPPSRIQKLSDLPDAGECLEAVAERQRRLSGGGGSGSQPSLQTSAKPKSGLVRPKSSGSSGIARRSLNLSNNGGEFRLQEGTSVFCNNELGVIRYMGPVDFAEGIWLGVELRTPRGKNDGSVQGRRYFTCKANHGLIVRPSKVTVRGINGAKLMGTADVTPSDTERKDSSY